MTVQNETTTHGVKLTEAAAAKAKALLDQEGRDDLALRIAVQPGGCAGLRYQLFFDDRNLDGDLIVDFGGVSLAVDRMSAPYVEGAVDRLRRHHREAGLHDRQPERHAAPAPAATPSTESRQPYPRTLTRSRPSPAGSASRLRLRRRPRRAERAPSRDYCGHRFHRHRPPDALPGPVRRAAACRPARRTSRCASSSTTS